MCVFINKYIHKCMYIYVCIFIYVYEIQNRYKAKVQHYENTTLRKYIITKVLQYESIVL